MDMKFTLKIKQNKTTKEYYVILPKKLTTKMKWGVGDKLKWTDNGDGSLTLQKIRKTRKR